MKLIACLSLLATLTAACGGSKGSSDKTPANAPVVSVDTNVDTHNPSKPSTNNSSNSGNTNTNNNNQHSNNNNGENQKPVEEVAKPLPEAFVGFGYNTLEHQVKESCLNGNVVLDTGLSSSAVAFARYESYQSFYKNVLKATENSVLNAWAGSEFSNKFFAEHSAESLSADYVFASSVISGTKRFTDSQLNVSLSPGEFHNKCGNSYISSAVIGGAFVAKVSLAFVSTESKLAFSEEIFDYSKLSQLLMQQAKTVSTERSIASVEITYGQIGGGGVLLTHMNTSDILKCGLDSEAEAQKCASTLEKLASYAVSQSFLDSIKRDPAVFTFTLGKY